MATAAIPFIDLAAQRRLLGGAIEAALQRVVDHGRYIMGPEVRQFEEKLAAFCGARHVVTCANGTEALGLVLKAKGVAAGDAVFCPAFSFCATAEAIASAGATPVFIDVLPDTFNMDPASLEVAVTTASGMGLRPTAVVPVDLFGQPADYEAIEAIAARDGLWVLCDAAQSFGAAYKGRKVGTIGLATAVSFFPAKPLGCYGDGGAVLTNDAQLADVVRCLRLHGRGVDKSDAVRIGMNSRLDTIQAAILIEKLRIFPDEIISRNKVAMGYNELLSDALHLPALEDETVSVWAQYTVILPEGADRSRAQQVCRGGGVPTAVYYPVPMHRQRGYAHYPANSHGLPVTEHLCERVLSLPMHPYLDPPTQGHIASTLIRGLAS